MTAFAGVHILYTINVDQSRGICTFKILYCLLSSRPTFCVLFKTQCIWRKLRQQLSFSFLFHNLFNGNKPECTVGLLPLPFVLVMPRPRHRPPEYGSCVHCGIKKTPQNNFVCYLPFFLSIPQFTALPCNDSGACTWYPWRPDQLEPVLPIQNLVMLPGFIVNTSFYKLECCYCLVRRNFPFKKKLNVYKGGTIK